MYDAYIPLRSGGVSAMRGTVLRCGISMVVALPMTAFFFTYSTTAHHLLETDYSDDVYTTSLLSTTLWNKCMKDVRSKLDNDLLTTYRNTVIAWTPINAINFMFVPPHLRMVYVSTLSMFWNAYMSLVQHHDVPVVDNDIVCVNDQKSSSSSSALDSAAAAATTTTSTTTL